MGERRITHLYDSARWDGLQLRPDDIIVSTPPKCGTTWVQWIVAMLIFDATELNAPLARLSPWLYMNTRPIAEVHADLAAQTHRRFIKSHLGYDALPHAEGLIHLCRSRSA